MSSKNPLGEEKISRLLVEYSVPAIVGMVVNSLYNVVDRIFIGNSVGPNGIGGITIGFPIMIILMSMGLLFGVGGATLFSIRLGEGKKKEAEHALGNAFVLLVITGVVFVILGQIFLKPLLVLFGASEAILPYSMEYMRIIFFGAVFQAVSMGMNNFVRADGSPRIAMLTMFLGAGLNTLLDPIFIYGLKMGMTGAALATVLAQGVSATWVVSYFLGQRSRNKLLAKYMKLKLYVVVKITSLGIPGFALQMVSSLLNVILNKSLLFYGGDIAVSGMGVVNSLMTLLFMPVIGIRQGVQPIISFNYGARKYERVKEATKLAIIAATVIVVTGYIITRLFPEQLIALFNRSPELLEFGSFVILTWLMCMPVVGFQIIGSSFFEAIGQSRTAMFLTLTRQVIFLIPALLIFSRLWGLKGLLHAAPFADSLSALLTGIWFLRSMKKLDAERARKSETVSATSTYGVK
ncbi:MAG: MATE family efflux transporter [Dethiobacteria bacterium]|jgi:putative MATE family efflux protein|nr:MATE family efflux transporter [Bacillota bacterium]